MLIEADDCRTTKGPYSGFLTNGTHMINSEFDMIRSGELSLHLISSSNVEEVRAILRGTPGTEDMQRELETSYLPRFDDDGRRTKYGFYSTLNDQPAGMCLLGISSWKNLRGYTGADTFPHMRGKGVAPDSKPHLFYLAFEVLGLNRVETGCLVSNEASRRSIEKTAGFQFEGTLREFGRNADGEFEDEFRWAILRSDWDRLYDKGLFEVV